MIKQSLWLLPFFLCSCAPRYEQPAEVDYPQEQEAIEEDDAIDVTPLEPLSEEEVPQKTSLESEEFTEEKPEKQEKPKEVLKKPAANSKTLIWPIKGKILKHFGDPSGKKGTVNGIVIQVAPNLRVKAAASGTVKEVTTIPDLGKVLILSHVDGKFSVYSPLKEISVKKGAAIKQGDHLGRTDRQPLWFRLYERKNGKKIAIDPMSFLS